MAGNLVLVLLLSLSWLADAELCSQPVGCQVQDNLVATVLKHSETECQHSCSVSAGCKFYTWYEGSADTKQTCQLLISCEETVECTGCASGPAICGGEFANCTVMKYNKLDDPTRNVQHGKQVKDASTL